MGNYNGRRQFLSVYGAHNEGHVPRNKRTPKNTNIKPHRDGRVKDMGKVVTAMTNEPGLLAIGSMIFVFAFIGSNATYSPSGLIAAQGTHGVAQLVAGLLWLAFILWRFAVFTRLTWAERLPKVYNILDIFALVAMSIMTLLTVYIAIHTRYGVGAWPGITTAGGGAASFQAGYEMLYTVILNIFGVGMPGGVSAGANWARFIVMVGILWNGIGILTVLVGTYLSLKDEQNDAQREALERELPPVMDYAPSSIPDAMDAMDPYDVQERAMLTRDMMGFSSQVAGGRKSLHQRAGGNVAATAALSGGPSPGLAADRAHIEHLKREAAMLRAAH